MLVKMGNVTHDTRHILSVEDCSKGPGDPTICVHTPDRCYRHVYEEKKEATAAYNKLLKAWSRTAGKVVTI